jgi:hypothetical protein
LDLLDSTHKADVNPLRDFVGMPRAGAALTTMAALLALLSQAACGGKAHGSDVPVETQGGSAGSPTGLVGGAGTGSAVAGGGPAAGAGMAGVGGSEPARTFPLDDMFPWFDAAGMGRFPVGETDIVLHLETTGAPARASTSTHNLIDMSWARSVQFSARASSPTHLLVSAGYMQLTHDYFTARESDSQWPTSSVEIDRDWQEFSVLVADMQPPEMRIGSSPSFFLAFSIEQLDQVEVWIDEVRFSTTD